MNRTINLKRVVDLGSEFITLAEAKTQLRVTFTDDDTEITSLITKARKAVENWCNISIVYQRIQFIGDLYVNWELPYGPVIGIESVENPLSTQGSGPVTYEVNGDVWWQWGEGMFTPTPFKRYRITYTAGNYCPEDLKQVILEVLTFMYENRGKTDETGQMERILEKAVSHKVFLWI